MKFVALFLFLPCCYPSDVDIQVMCNVAESGIQLTRANSLQLRTRYSMLPYFPDTPISGHLDFTILYFVVKGKQIRTIRSKDLSTSPLSFVLFAAELRFV